MSLENIRTKLANALNSNIPAVAWNSYIVDYVAPPMGWVHVPDGTVHITLSGTGEQHLQITALAPRGGDVLTGQQLMDSLLTGATSVPNVIEAVDLSPDATSRAVSRKQKYGILDFAGQKYLGAVFDVYLLIG
jgi:hypothetical protein